MKTKEKEEILGALARGYCSPENQGKTLDVDVVRAMGLEMIKLIDKNYCLKTEQKAKFIFCPPIKIRKGK